MAENSENSRTPNTTDERGEGSFEEGFLLEPQNPDEEFYLLVRKVEESVGKLSDEELEMLRDLFDGPGLDVGAAIEFVKAQRTPRRPPSPDPVNPPKNGRGGPSGSKY